MSELKPCEYCKEIPELQKGIEFPEIIEKYRYRCPRCNIASKFAYSLSGAIEAWNRGQKMDKCNWCEPGHEICGTCMKFFDYYGDGTDKCSADFGDTGLCSGYETINYCPNCGRKLRTEDGKRKAAD